MKKRFVLAFILIILASLTGCGQFGDKAITGKEDLENARIGVLTGSTSEMYVRQNFPAADLKCFDDTMDAVAALKSEQLDAVITLYPTALNVFKRNSDLDLLPDRLHDEDTAIAVRKEDTKLLTSLNEVIAELEADGTLKDMERRWLKKDLTPYETVSIELPKSNNVLKIAVSATREPFCFKDADGNVTGFDGELARRIAAKLGMQIEFSDMKFSALLNSLQSNKSDVIISMMTATDERKKAVDFTTPYFHNSSAVLVNKTGSAKDTAKLKTLDDIKDKRVAVYTGTIHDAFVAEKYPQAEIKRYDSSADMILSLKNEKVDVALIDAISANVILKKNKDLGVFTDDVLTRPLGIGFNKNNPALRDRFNNYLKEARLDGTYDEMYERWCINDPEEAIMPDFKHNAAGEKVVLAVAVEDLPYVAAKNGEYVGFDIEMIKRFAEHEGIQLEIMTTEFSSLLAALSSGKADMIADGIAITEERKKQIDFSNSYMDFKTAAIALKKNIDGYDGNSNAAVAATSWLDSVSSSFHNNIIIENRYLLIIDGLKVTIIISILACFFGTLLGALVCFMRMSKNRLLKGLAKIYISILRGLPVLVLLMLIFYVVFASVNISPIFVAVVAFGMNFAAYVSEMFRTSIEGVDKGQTEAGIAGGFTKLQTFLYIVMPQAIRQVLPVYKGEFVSLVKMTSIVGYIAVQDLTKASDIIRSRTFDAFFPLIMVAVLYFVISWLLTLSLEIVELKTNPKAKRKQVKKA